MKTKRNTIGDARHYKDEIKDLVGKKLPICVDFDGCLCAHHYPMIGKENKPCVEVLKKWQENGVGIILDTMRDGKQLEEAVQWCKDRGIKLYGIGKEPGQEKWTRSNKCYGIFSVDDRNLGVPLITEEGERPRVDWKKIDELYTEQILELAKSYKNT